MIEYTKFTKIIKDGFKNNLTESEIMNELAIAGLPYGEIRQYFRQTGLEIGAIYSAEKKAEIVNELISLTIKSDSKLSYKAYKLIEDTLQKQCTFDVKTTFKNVYHSITGNKQPSRINNEFVGQYRVLCDYLMKNPLATEAEIKAFKLRKIGKSGDQDNQIIKMVNFMHEFYPVYLAAKQKGDK
ncbi:MAG: hypothetical protein HOG49_21725 [Candidatus Scalindua sp.]|nr:hypothetical protein [Candidatus Scalindua sp.]